MNIHEFGTGNEDVIVLIHPSLVYWDYFYRVIPLLESSRHLVVPALPGYDAETASDFTSVEAIARELADWLDQQHISRVSCLYGCSMGGSIVLRFLADRRIPADSAVIDGGITPYQLPRLVTRLIAVRDYLMISAGKLGGIKLLEKAFAADEYSAEDLQYVSDVLRHASARTIWNTFDSCNNYQMPDTIRTACGHIEYWVTAKEEKERAWDIAYLKEHLPQTVFKRFDDIGHGGMALLRPEDFAKELERCIQLGKEH